MGVPTVVSPGAKVKSGWANDVVSQLVPLAWVNIAPGAFGGTWVNFGAPWQVARYRKIGDMTYIEGVIKSGTINTAAFTLPVGFRPPADLAFPQDAAGLFGVLTVTAAGVVTPLSGGTTLFSINCMFATI